jgi:hydrogenase-1 operon protein HyaF
VEAKVETLGTTQIRETGISGVWWITHFNAAAEVIGEFIEVTRAPKLMLAQRPDMMRGLETLKARLEMAGRG